MVGTGGGAFSLLAVEVWEGEDMVVCWEEGIVVIWEDGVV